MPAGRFWVAASHDDADKNRDSDAVRPPSERATSGELLIGTASLAKMMSG